MSPGIMIHYPYLKEREKQLLNEAPLPPGFVKYYAKEAPKTQYQAIIQQRKGIPQHIQQKLSATYQIHLLFADHLAKSLETILEEGDELFVIVNAKTAQDFLTSMKITPHHLYQSLRFYESLLNEQRAWHLNTYYLYDPESLASAIEKLEHQADLFGAWLSAHEKRLRIYKMLFYQKKLKALDVFVLGEMIQQILMISNYYQEYFKKQNIKEKDLQAFGKELIEELLEKGEEIITQEDTKKYYHFLHDHWELLNKSIQDFQKN